MHEKLKDPVRQITGLLVDGKYLEVETLTHGVRLTAPQMATAIAEYGRLLVSLPDHAFDLMNVAEVRNAKPSRWSVVMPLWTREEGRSDLSLELTITDLENGFAIELEDIHVL
jgi:hypothetical protein